MKPQKYLCKLGFVGFFFLLEFAIWWTDERNYGEMKYTFYWWSIISRFCSYQGVVVVVSHHHVSLRICDIYSVMVSHMILGQSKCKISSKCLDDRMAVNWSSWSCLVWLVIARPSNSARFRFFLNSKRAIVLALLISVVSRSTLCQRHVQQAPQCLVGQSIARCLSLHLIQFVLYEL